MFLRESSYVCDTPFSTSRKPSVEGALLINIYSQKASILRFSGNEMLIPLVVVVRCLPSPPSRLPSFAYCLPSVALSQRFATSDG